MKEVKFDHNSHFIDMNKWKGKIEGKLEDISKEVKSKSNIGAYEFKHHSQPHTTMQTIRAPTREHSASISNTPEYQNYVSSPQSPLIIENKAIHLRSQSREILQDTDNKSSQELANFGDDRLNQANKYLTRRERSELEFIRQRDFKTMNDRQNYFKSIRPGNMHESKQFSCYICVDLEITAPVHLKEEIQN